MTSEGNENRIPAAVEMRGIVKMFGSFKDEFDKASK